MSRGCRLAPYRALGALRWCWCRLASQEPPFAQAAPNLVFGGLLLAREARGALWVGVLDLAAEFGAARALREVPHYHSLPVLDATAPTEDELREAVAWLGEVVRHGPVYVHCALGHGRSATVVVAYLLSAGLVASVGEGEALLRSLRGGVRLNAQQVRRLHEFESQRESAAEPSAAPDRGRHYGFPRHHGLPGGPGR